MFPGVSHVINAFFRQNAPHTAPGPAPAPPGAYTSAGSVASFFARWKAATAGCRAGSGSSAPPAPPEAAGRRLCRCGPHDPFRSVFRGPCIRRRRPCLFISDLSRRCLVCRRFLLTSLWPIGRRLSTTVACFTRPRVDAFWNLQKVHRIFEHFCL